MSENGDTTDNAGILTHPPVFYIGATLIGFGLDYVFPLAIGYRNMTGLAAIVATYALPSGKSLGE